MKGFDVSSDLRGLLPVLLSPPHTSHVRGNPTIPRFSKLSRIFKNVTTSKIRPPLIHITKPGLFADYRIGKVNVVRHLFGCEKRHHISAPSRISCLGSEIKSILEVITKNHSKAIFMKKKQIFKSQLIASIPYHYHYQPRLPYIITPNDPPNNPPSTHKTTHRPPEIKKSINKRKPASL